MRSISTFAALVVSLAAQDPLSLGPARPSHVTIATSVDAKSATPGQKISLYADITPKPQIHVYAPGADSYQPIRIVLESQRGVTAGALRYPKSELLINEFERVPVFQKPFRLVQEVVVARTAAGDGPPTAPVTIKGTVTYQACDDEVCFKPESVPVTWQIAVK